jgi:putative transposase
VIRQLGITEQTFYRWKRKYGGLGPAELRKLRLLEGENKKLKQMVAENRDFRLRSGSMSE